MSTIFKPLRIAIVTNNYTPYSGGVVSSINAVTHGLQRAGHEVSIITLDFLGQEHHAKNDPAWVVRVPCPIKFTYKTNYMAMPLRATQHLERIMHQVAPDLIHAQHPFLLGSAAVQVARAHNIPIVFTYHSMYEAFAHYVPLPQWLTQPAVKAAVLVFCKSVDGIVVPSCAVQEYLKEQELAQPMAVIPTSVRSFFLRETYEPRVHRPKESFFKLLVVSRMVKEKNIPLIFELFEQVRHDQRFTLTLVGYGAEYDALQRQAYDEYRFSPDVVRFIHKPEQDHLVRLYDEADLFLFSSTNDTQGIVLAEAMARGLPVVAIDGPGQRDIIEQGLNGFLCTSREEMAHNIRRIAAEPELHAALRKNAFETAKRYDPALITKKLLAFYTKIVGGF